MTTRRSFVRSVLGFSVATSLGIPASRAATRGNGRVTGWAGASDPALLQRVWSIRFTNALPWALDPTNAVLAKALNVDASGNVPVLNVTLNSNLPALGFILKPDPGTTSTYSLKAGQTVWPMLGPLGGKFADGTPIPTTTLWGYGNGDLEHIFTNGSGFGVTFPARSFVVQRGQPITVNWYNNLFDASGPLPHLLGVDQTISMQTADLVLPGGTKTTQAINGVPIAVHHHGGDNAAEFDGGPDQWFTPQRQQVGPGITSANSPVADHLTYLYANSEEASMHWYHDHGEGVTRINAYAGLAGLYVIRDANEAALISARKMPTGEQEIPVVIQDKIFQANGQLAYTADIPVYSGWNTLSPAATRKLPGYFPIQVDANGLPLIDPATGNPPVDPSTGYYVAAGPVGAFDPNDPAAVTAGSDATHVPEMFGDIICVNGVAWPTLAVERRQYRLRLLNGSDSRVYNLSFGGLRFFQVGTDVGLLNLPVPLRAITIFPGERKDIVIDFSPLRQGSRLTVTNDAPFPYPGGTPTAPTDPWATIMQIAVTKPINERINKPSELDVQTVLRGRSPDTPLLPVVTTVPRGMTRRQILLGEGCDEYGRIMPLLGTVAEGTKSFHDPADIFPALGSTEVWEFWNTTVDAHPIHMHLVRFRIANRENFTAPIAAKAMANGWTGVALAAPPVLAGRPTPAPATEQGWKDTVVCPPGMVTRVIAQFTRPGKYVYHCHILGHEEHDMMRWYEVR